MHDVPRVDRSGEELLRVWATWTPSPPHLVLAEDQDVLRSLYDDESAVVTFDGWKETYRDEQFGALGDRRLHLSLIPQPFFGDLARASIFVLLLNPGVGPHDYYGEFEVPAFRDALLANLRQEFPPGSVPFVFLDPQFSWHGGYDWWHGKLARVIARLAHENDMPFAAARRFVAERLACIELLPYHSASFGIGDRWIQDLPSVR
ncbi:MAG TPA: hypothetical protein VKE69_01595, partial [Planctomycetota bacterium]|nr:hypothetical protein [Planctomycetota bacterium]